MRPEYQAIRKQIGTEVKCIRKALDLTQVELSEKINLDSAYLSKIERGIKPLSSVHLLLILSLMEPDDSQRILSKLSDTLKNQGLITDKSE